MSAPWLRLLAGAIDPKLLTHNANFYFTPEVLGDYRASLSVLVR